MRKTSKKRILRWVILDILGFCVMAYLICAQVFRFFPWKPVDISADMTVLATPIPVLSTPTAAPTPTVAPTPTEAPTPVPSAPDATTGSEPIVETPPPEITPAPTETPEPTPTPTPEPSGLLKGKFAEKFSLGQVVSTETEYRSENVAIELTAYTGYVCTKCNHTSANYGPCPNCGHELRNSKSDRVTYTVADIYIQDIASFQTAYARKGAEKKVREMCTENGGLLAINTDMYQTSLDSKHGWFVRNGVELKRYDKLSGDLCILYYDGTMETVEKQNVDVNGIYAKYPKHIWYFGPALLGADGSAKEKFNLTKIVANNNPRSAIGYYEPGHYCFLTVDGRDGERGLSMAELSMLCADMGMAAAYNMDGGASSAMYFNGKNYGQNGRSTTDIAYIAEPAKEN